MPNVHPFLTHDMKCIFANLVLGEQSNSWSNNRLNRPISLEHDSMIRASKCLNKINNFVGSSTDIGICLTRIVLRHRAIEAHLQTLTRYAHFASFLMSAFFLNY